MKLKHVLFFLLAVFVLYSVWLVFGVVSYRQYKASPAAGSQWEAEGAYHIHTTLSDGLKSPDKVVKIAARSSLDFIILTDHGSPNREAHKVEGWKEGVLLLAGSELSTSRGHLVALDYDLPESRFFQNADQAAIQIRQLNGFSIIAHPYSKIRWTWGDSLLAEGMEIINADSMLKRNFFRWLPFLPSALVSPKYFTLKILDFPEQNMRKWNELSFHQKIYAYFSTDAHALYRPLFAFLRLHVVLSEPLSEEFGRAKHQVMASLREGHFYNAVEAAAEADGFRFWAEKGTKKIPMGSSENASGQVRFRVLAPFPFSTKIQLLCNGKIVSNSSNGEIDFLSEQPGTYRVEVYLEERSPLAGGTPWIVSNPIFFTERKP